MKEALEEFFTRSYIFINSGYFIIFLSHLVDSEGLQFKSDSVTWENICFTLKLTYFSNLCKSRDQSEELDGVSAQSVCSSSEASGPLTSLPSDGQQIVKPKESLAAGLQGLLQGKVGGGGGGGGKHERRSVQQKANLLIFALDAFFYSLSK